MTQKTAYLWGPVSIFSGPLAAALVKKGWHVHVATKPSLNLFSLSPLDLKSSARESLEQAFGGHENFRAFQEKLKFVEPGEAGRGVKYDAIIFCGLPPNFDESRAPRAPWAASELIQLMKGFKGVPVFILSSIWGGVQKDGVVPEELEFERRKPLSHWESICQHYESRLQQALSESETTWYLIRMPLIMGSTTHGETPNFSGPYCLMREIANGAGPEQAQSSGTLKISYNPDASLWFLPVDIAVYMFSRFLEDEGRPRICNLVSTQSILNREWLHQLAEAAGYKDVSQVDKDSLSISGAMRKLLTDSVQVKTRNLFEVAARYQMPHMRVDKDYFVKLLRVARSQNWGQPSKGTKKEPTFSEKLATYYFEDFVPAHFDQEMLRKATANGTTIGFILKESAGLSWVLRAKKGKALVERLDPEDEKPRICFHISGKTMTNLIQSKLPLHRALLLREVEVEGPLLHALRVASVIEQFLKSHPVDLQQIEALQVKEEATV